MAGHQVTANFIAEFRRALNVNAVALADLAQIGYTQGLFHQVKTHSRAVYMGDGQAAAVVRYGSPGFEPRQHMLRQLHDVGAKVRFFIDRHHFGGPLHNTGKHILLLYKFVTVSVPF